MANDRKIRILVVDDHAVVRTGLRALIEAQPDMEVVAEAGSGAEAVTHARELAPDLITLDIAMPGTVATDTIETLRRICPKGRLVVLTMHEDPLYLRSVMAAGAAGYLVKSAASSALVLAIRRVHAGGTYVDESLANAYPGAASSSTAGPSPAAGTPGLEQLSERERDVLALIAQGHAYKEIADKLRVSVNSVGSYRARLVDKLGVHTRAELTRLAQQQGLASPG